MTTQSAIANRTKTGHIAIQYLSLDQRRVPLHKLIDRIRPRRRISKQRSYEVDELVDGKVNQRAFLEEVRDINHAGLLQYRIQRNGDGSHR